MNVLSGACAAILISLSGAAGALAESITWNVGSSAPGDYITIDQVENGERRRVHHVYRGESRGRHLIDTYWGDRPEGEPLTTTYLDDKGNYLRWVRRDGFELRFRPHDCTRTVGRCGYTEIFPDGRRERRERVTTPESGGFSFVEYDADGNERFRGRFEIDERGAAGTGFVAGVYGRRTDHKLVQRVYQ